MTDAYDRLRRGEITIARVAEIEDVTVWDVLHEAAEREIAWADESIAQDLEDL